MQQFPVSRAHKKPVYTKWWFWVIAAFSVIMVIATATGGGDSTPEAAPVVAQITEPTPEATEQPTEQPTESTSETELEQPSDDLSMSNTPEATPQTITPTPENVIDVDYIYMWENYSDDLYKANWVRITGKISERTFLSVPMLEWYFQDDIDGYISLGIDEDDLDKFSEGDYLTVTGRVVQKFWGGMILEYSEYRLATTDEISQLSQNEDERKQNTQQTIADYKASCITVSYDDLVRNPQNYEGEAIKVTVKIQQEMVGGLLTASGYRGTSSGNEWFINYDLPDGSSRILVNDTVTFYGEFSGLTKITRALTGTKEYVPELNAMYHE